MATKKQKAAAKRQRTAAVQRMKAATTPKAKARARSQVLAAAKIMKAKTTEKATASGDIKRSFASLRKTAAQDILKDPKATAAQKAAALQRRDANIATMKDTKRRLSAITPDSPITSEIADTALKRSPESYRPNVPTAGSGDDVFFGTNIPTKGCSEEQISDFNRRLQDDINAGNTRSANDVIFSIAYAKGGGQGNPRVGAVQSGMYKLNEGPLWAEQFVNSNNDRYVVRDSSGKPTGQEIRYSDTAGVVKGKEGNWESTGSWGGNEKAGIREGQPTTAPPPSGVRSKGITTDTGAVIAAGDGTPTRTFSPGSPMVDRIRPGTAGGYGGAYGGGLLGGGGYGGYPVLGMGAPSGLSYPAAAEAAEGYAGALGFNIGPEGGLVYRPWEARAWQQTGIDPNLWNAPFAGSGLLGGGYPGVGYPGRGYTGGGQPGAGTGGPMPTGDTTQTTPTTPTTTVLPGEPAGWAPPLADINAGFKYIPALQSGPFMQWTQWKHQQNQANNAANWTDPNALFEDRRASQQGLLPAINPLQDKATFMSNAANSALANQQLMQQQQQLQQQQLQQQQNYQLAAGLLPPAGNPFIEPAIPATTATVDPTALAWT